MAREVVLKHKQGSTWRQTLRLKADGAARDLTGWKVRGAIRKTMTSVNAEVEFDSDAGTVEITEATGTMVFVIPSDVSSALDTDNKLVEWVFDFELYDDTVSPELVEGKTEYTFKVQISPDGTRA